MTPNVKPGWKITTTKVGTGENTKITEIIWTGGNIPAGQRDEFMFSAKVPAAETSLPWKAYQTYSTGEVVAWDQDPKNNTSEEVKPFSVTNVINDLKAATSTTSVSTSSPSHNTLLILALVISVLALIISLKKK